MLFCILGLAARADSVVVFNEIMYHPATNEAALEWIELYSQNAVDVDVGGWRLSGGIDYVFPGGTVIKGGGHLVVAVEPAALMAQAGISNVLGPFTGRLSNGGETIRLRDLTDRVMDEVTYDTDAEWPAGADGSGVSLAKKHPNLPSQPAENWTVSRQASGTPGAPNFPVAAESVVIVTTNLTLVPFSTSWRYYESGDPGAGWSGPGFDDSGWGAGLALLGFETNTLPVPLLTTLTLGQTAYYFRTGFDYVGNPAGATLYLRQVVDDGVVVYLNGVEVLRTGLAEGPVTHDTLASRGVGDAIVEGPFVIPSDNLVSGRNTLAVEVHQTATNSTDIVFGLQLDEQRVLGTVTNAAGVPPLTGATTHVVPLAATWRFNDTGMDLGSAWRRLAYDDSAWVAGPALFFAEDAPLPGPKNTPLNPGRNTYYFRTVFPFEGDPSMKLLSFRTLLDDGAVVYLNGAEVGRVNMPTGAVSYATMALTTVADATLSGSFRIASSNLVVGQNVLAVELHQANAQTNAGLLISPASAYKVTWDGGDGDFFSPGSPALAPTNAALAALGVEVFTSSNTNLAANLIDGRYGSSSAWYSAANDLNPLVVLRFNQVLSLFSIAWSRDNGDTNESACGGTCADRTLGNYTIQYTLVTNPAIVIANSSNPSNGWTSIATVQYLSAQPGFTPHLRHRYDFAAKSGSPILATGVRFRPATTNAVDEVEINPPALTNFDAVFGMELTLTDLLPPAPKLAFNEVAASSSNAFWLEIINYGDAPAELGGVTIVRAGDAASGFIFPAQALPPGGSVALSQAQLDFGAADGQKLFLYAPGRFQLLDSVTVRASARGRFPDGVGDWMYPTQPTPGGANAIELRRDIVINEMMYHAPPIDPVPAVTSNVTLVPITGAWRYEDTGTDLGTEWRAPGYNDSAWPTGPGLLAFNTGVLPAPSGTTLAADRTTYYFRTRFDFSGATSNVTLDVVPVVDDGAVFYLNGVEIHRRNMPPGPVAYATSALSPVGDAGYANPIVVPASSLIQGVNVLAVEVHQVTPATTSSGIVLSGGGLTLVEEGPFGGSPPMTLARQPGAAPFAKDSLVGYSYHQVVGLTDGNYGNNAGSWIGNTPANFCGVNFGGRFTIHSIAFGRDNLGAFTDRTFGTYKLQYTRVASPGIGTTVTGNPDTGWATIGTLNYQNAGTGLFTLPSRRHRFTFTPVEATGLRLDVPDGACIDELEVNPPDTSGDIAFGAALALTTTLAPAVPYSNSGEEWVELFNRSTQPVDLTNWRLDAGIDFRFTNGPVIPPEGYVVVARDAAALRAKWPELAASIVGDFSGRLQGGERFLLRDAAGNPVDETRVFEGGWSDGGGSSLELRDPAADHLNPGAWADSDESAKSAWQTVTYRMVAGQSYGPTRWNEFRIGLLDRGVVLLDDVSVVRDPDGAREQLIQNGNFETTTGNTHWRFLGHHRGEFVTDPENAGNHVLRLSAEDRAVMNHNHVETTFLNNRAITNGQLFEVSYRGRWVAGSPQVSTRAYFGKLAKTTWLAMPTRVGTPAAPNSRRVTNAGPTFAGLQHAPIVPSPNQTVTISVRASDPDGVASATVNYRVNPAAAFTALPMTLQSTGAWTASLPGQAAGKVVQFYVTALDALGISAFAPAKGPDSRALYQVADTQGTALPTHELRLIMLDADRDFMFQPTNVMSNARNGATLIYDRTEVFYDAGARLQGTAASRIRDGDNYVCYDIDFPPGQLFRGVQNNIGIDRSGRSPTARGHDEMYVFQMFHRAGIPVPYHDLCYFISPRTVHTGTAILQLAGYGGGFVAEQYGEAGSVFNMDIIYEPDTTVVPTDPESPKLPVPHQAHISTELFTDLGDQEQYRSPFDIRLGNRRDDYAGLMRLCRTMALPQAEFDAEIASVLDVDEALRMSAMGILCGIGDTYISSSAGLPHNLRLVTFPDGDPAQFLPWDMDFTFNAGTSSSIFITSGWNLGKLMNHPATRRLYLQHIHDLCQTVFTTNYISPWLAHYGSMVGQNFSAAATYIASRRTYALTQLPPEVPFAITSNGGNDFSADTNFVTLAGTGWLDVRALEVNGLPYAVNWTTLTNWSLTVPLAAGVNLLTVQVVDMAGQRPTNRTDTITITNTGPGALLPVVINEWMADNAGRGGFPDPVDGLFQDWFELYNPNPVPVNLSGYHLTDSLVEPNKWTIPGNVVIGPYGFLLVWADGDTAQNGTGSLGDLHASFKLNNTGEALGLCSPNGVLQHAVVFGAQVQNVSQGLYPDGDTNAVHAMSNWTPRLPNRVTAPPPPLLEAFVLESRGTLSFQFAASPGRLYAVQVTEDLSAPQWRILSEVRATDTLLQITDDTLQSGQRFYRVVLVE